MSNELKIKQTSATEAEYISSNIKTKRYSSVRKLIAKTEGAGNTFKML